MIYKYKLYFSLEGFDMSRYWWFLFVQIWAQSLYIWKYESIMKISALELKIDVCCISFLYIFFYFIYKSFYFGDTLSRLESCQGSYFHPTNYRVHKRDVVQLVNIYLRNSYTLSYRCFCIRNHESRRPEWFLIQKHRIPKCITNLLPRIF